MISTKELFKKYGKPNESGVPYLTTLILPYPMRLSWDKNVIVTKIRCHKLVANNLELIFNDLLKKY